MCVLMLADLVPGGGGEDEGGEDGQLVFGVQRPALHGDAHRQTEDRHRLRQRKRLLVLRWVPTEQTCSTKQSDTFYPESVFIITPVSALMGQRKHVLKSFRVTMNS